VKKECFHVKLIRKINFEAKAKVEDYKSQNVIGSIRGKSKPDSVIVVSAHYDHLGRVGSAYFPGANDNSSGVSMMLELANFYSLKENQLDYSIVFMAFSAEEAGLVGSKFYVNNPLFPLSKIKFLINLDLLGTGDEGAMVVNATKFPIQFNQLNKINEEGKLLSALKQRGPAPNSDHYYFTEKGVPAFFIYTLGGIAAYHDIYDKAETLPLTKFKEVFSLLTKFISTL
jgi:aminopeptidase YwaD